MVTEYSCNLWALICYKVGHDFAVYNVKLFSLNILHEDAQALLCDITHKLTNSIWVTNLAYHYYFSMYIIIYYDNIPSVCYLYPIF